MFLICWLKCTRGSVIGAILLVGGLYFVLWGKAKEEEMEKEECQQIVDVEKACEGSMGQMTTATSTIK